MPMGPETERLLSSLRRLPPDSVRVRLGAMLGEDLHIRCRRSNLVHAGPFRQSPFYDPGLSSLSCRGRCNRGSGFPQKPFKDSFISSPSSSGGGICGCKRTLRIPTLGEKKLSFGNRGSYNREPREMTKVTCSDCGKECEVPFKPTQGRPVYCEECYRKHRPRRY